MEIREGWVVVLVIGALVVGLGIGYAFSRDDVASDCKQLGRFSHGRNVYECKPVFRVE